MVKTAVIMAAGLGTRFGKYTELIPKGFVEYNNNGALAKKTVDVDTELDCSKIENDICDAIAFALYGKTIYNDIVRPEVGVPFIALNIEYNSKAIYIARQPEYIRSTHFGSTYLAEGLHSIKTEAMEYDSLQEEEYFSILKDYIDITFEEFASSFKA